MPLKRFILIVCLMLISFGLFTTVDYGRLFAAEKTSPFKPGLESLRIFNVALSVPNIDTGIKWYSDALGFSLKQRRKVSTGIEIALIEKNGFFIDLIQIADSNNIEGTPKDPPQHLLVQGLRNIVFYVDNLKAVDAHLKSKGIKLMWESRYIPEIKTSVTNFRDPFGNLVAIWERKPGITP